MTGLSSTMNALSWLMGQVGRGEKRRRPRLDRARGAGRVRLRWRTMEGHAQATPDVRVSTTEVAGTGPRSAASSSRILPTARSSSSIRRACASAMRRRPSVRPACRRRRWWSARSASPSRTCSARSSPRRWSRSGRPATHQQGLGNTGILEQALASGAIDLYPEYTGTIVRELLKRDGQPVARRAQPLARAARAEGRGAARLQQHLRAGDDARRRRSALGIAPHLRPVRAGRAPRCGSACRTSSSSAATAGRRCAQAYGGAAPAPIGLDHGLAYDARRRRPRRRHRRLLDRRQDRPARPARCSRTTARFFPEVRRRAPDARARRRGAAGRARRLDRRRDDDRDERRGRARRPQLRRDGDEIPRRRLRVAGAAAAPAAARRAARGARRPTASLVERVFAPDFARLAGQHLLLVFGSLALALAVGVPLGIAAWRWPRSGGAAARRRRGAADDPLAGAARLPDRARRQRSASCRR